MRRLGLTFILVIMLLSACQTDKSSLSKNIVGNWANSSGYTIEFFDDGKGVIPGVTNQIPDATFNYLVTDLDHVSIDLGNQKYTIQVKIVGDELTWTDSVGVETYTRVKK